MVDVAILKAVGFTAVALLVVGWLVVSFQSPGRARRLATRFSAAALYLALVCLFVQLTQENWARGRAVLFVPFGFLLLVFVSGLALTLAKGVGELARTEKGTGAHATH